MLFKDKIKKTAFINKLVTMFGAENLSKRNYSEETAEGSVTMTLYYVNNVHAGTWCRGEGWIFDVGWTT